MVCVLYVDWTSTTVDRWRVLIRAHGRTNVAPELTKPFYACKSIDFKVLITEVGKVVIDQITTLRNAGISLR